MLLIRDSFFHLTDLMLILIASSHILMLPRVNFLAVLDHVVFEFNVVFPSDLDIFLEIADDHISILYLETVSILLSVIGRGFVLHLLFELANVIFQPFNFVNLLLLSFAHFSLIFSDLFVPICKDFL